MTQGSCLFWPAPRMKDTWRVSCLESSSGCGRMEACRLVSVAPESTSSMTLPHSESLSFLAYFLPCTAVSQIMTFALPTWCCSVSIVATDHVIGSCSACADITFTLSWVIIDIIPSIMAHDSNLLYANFSKMQICPVFSKLAVNPYLLHTTQMNNSMA